MAGAYTVFANEGVRLSPTFLRSVQDRTGDPLPTEKPEKKAVLDRRVAYVMTDMLQAVLHGGTASTVGARFHAPAAGKTGSSHDAWFAGYTSNLLCLVWVGNDDYTDIKLEGARAAAPLWTEFMLRAQKLPRYRDMKPFTPPPGVVRVSIDKASNLPANETCPEDYEAYFIDGTIPAATCDHPSGPTPNFFERMFGIGKHPPVVLPPITQPEVNPAASGPVPQPGPLPAIDPNQPVTPAPAPEEKQKKRGFWKRLFSGRDKAKKEENQLKPE
jgi:penicillin-binding protein 1B